MQRLVHVIDSDYARRARVARELHGRNLHAEIYEDLDEFTRHRPNKGFVFVADDEVFGGALEIAQTLRSTGTALPVVVYASEPSPERVVSAMLDGALDYLAWPFKPLLLERAFRRLSTEGERRFEQETLRQAAKAKIEKLSSREREVLLHLTQGLGNRGIAEALQISPRTVEIHRGNMMRKLNARTPSDAVRTALYGGLDGDFQPIR
jgi:two-component system, LuxR family, response regulator FixJ